MLKLRGTPVGAAARRLWLTLSVAQTLVFAAAPLADARAAATARDREAGCQTACNAGHQPSDCLFCQAAATRVVPATPSAVPSLASSDERHVDETRAQITQSAPRITRSRSPPFPVA